MTKRLTRDDWIDYGLSSLSRSGFKSLRAGPLAQALGVSRGSFYWHFSDMSEFELELMRAWQQRTTDSVIKQLESDRSAENRLSKLVGLTLSNELNLDKAMRSWSMEDKRAQEFVAEVDQQRINYVESLLDEIKPSSKDTSFRAKILYWSCIGRSVVEPSSKSAFGKNDIKRLTNLFLR